MDRFPDSCFAGLVIRGNRILDPSEVFVFADESEWTINDGIFGVFRSPIQSWFSVPSGRHSQGANFSFADGHCEHWTWSVSKRMQRIGSTAMNSADEQDLQRLQKAIPDAP